MDEQNTALKSPDGGRAPVLVLREGMDREAELFTRLCMQMDRLGESFQAKKWTESLTIAQGFESSAREIEAADHVRDAAFASLKSAIGAPSEEPFAAVLSRIGAEERSALDESWRGLRSSIFRLRSATGRLRYSTQIMGDTLNRVLEGIFPHRRGKIYTRHGTPTQAVGSLLIDREL
jgi:hypothetical protein